jgi:MSHA biogenesis protein MshQ
MSRMSLLCNAALTALMCGAPVHAAPILPSVLAGFSVLGATTVTSTGMTVLSGDLGVSPGTSITGFGPGVAQGTTYSAGPVAAIAHDQLGTAIGMLQQLGPGTPLAASLDDLTLAPGVYTVDPAATNLTRTLILDGGGNAAARWVFLMPTTLITSPGSLIRVINTGINASVYWVVGSSATLGTPSTFAGNVLAYTSITMNSGVNITCGRALALNAAVTMISDTVNSTSCAGSGNEGSSGLNGEPGNPAPPPSPPPSATTAACRLVFAVPNHRAETTQTFLISMVSVTDLSLPCASAPVSVARTVLFHCSYVDPTSGTLPVRLGSNVPLAAGPNQPCSNNSVAMTLSFNAAGVANAALIYADAGKLRLDASYQFDGGTISTGSNSFIVAPARFSVDRIAQSAAPGRANPVAADANGAAFIGAGNAFSASVTALNQAGSPTPNFGQEILSQNVLLSAALVVPTTGTMPALAGSLGAFSGGTARATNLSWSDVGIIRLDARLADGYLGTGSGAESLPVTGSSESVGRFIADHFDTTIPSGIPMPCPTGLTCPAAGFVYAGQAFGVVVTARSLSGKLASNHSGLLARPVTLSAWQTAGGNELQNPPVSPTGNRMINADLPATAFYGGVAVTSTPAYAFASSYPADIAGLAKPTRIFLRAGDSDDVTSLRGLSSIESGLMVVGGRLLIANNYGSELLPLPIRIRAQYLGTSGYVNSTTDNRSTFRRTNITLSNCTKNLGAGNACTTALAMTATPSDFVLINGTTEIRLAAPGAGKNGSVDLRVEGIAWLPSTIARTRIGIYKAGPVIYFRELY